MSRIPESLGGVPEVEQLPKEAGGREESETQEKQEKGKYSLAELKEKFPQVAALIEAREKVREEERAKEREEEKKEEGEGERRRRKIDWLKLLEKVSNYQVEFHPIFSLQELPPRGTKVVFVLETPGGGTAWVVGEVREEDGKRRLGFGRYIYSLGERTVQTGREEFFRVESPPAGVPATISRFNLVLRTLETSRGRQVAIPLSPGTPVITNQVVMQYARGEEIPPAGLENIFQGSAARSATVSGLEEVGIEIGSGEAKKEEKLRFGKGYTVEAVLSFPPGESAKERSS